MGGSEQLARLAGGLVGVGLAIAAAFPFNGVPPHGVSGRPVPAQVEVRVLAAGVYTITPLGEALKPTAFPAPGQHGGPSLSLRVTNASPLPLRMTMRLTALSPSLDDAVKVRASGAGAVLINGSLRSSANWSTPAGLLASGGTTTVRVRFKLMKGLSPDDYDGRLDVRQLELDGKPASYGPTTPTTPTGAAATTPVATTPATTPVVEATPVPTVTPAASPAPPGTPTPTVTPRPARH